MRAERLRVKVIGCRGRNAARWTIVESSWCECPMVRARRDGHYSQLLDWGRSDEPKISMFASSDSRRSRFGLNGAFVEV